jgi:hypothetical protein
MAKRAISLEGMSDYAGSRRNVESGISVFGLFFDL